MLLSLEFMFLISNQILALSSHSFIADGIAWNKEGAYPYITKECIGFYSVTPTRARGPYLIINTVPVNICSYSPRDISGRIPLSKG